LKLCIVAVGQLDNIVGYLQEEIEGFLRLLLANVRHNTGVEPELNIDTVR
jgi:hypothetical protein